jgi:predicted DsbA family dithiol-disulfide isomerase
VDLALRGYTRPVAGSPLNVDVWADVACPWCYIGHRRLSLALEEEPPGAVRVRPRAFELQPDLPPAGLPAEDFYARKFGSPEAMLAAFERTAAEARRSGLELRFDRMRRAPNTRLAHRLVVIARRRGRALHALRALFAGHFEHGADVSDADQAIALVASAADISVDELVAGLEAGEGEPEVASEEAVAARLGITAVPFFLAGGAVALSGAHEPGVLRDLIAAARQAAQATASSPEGAARSDVGPDSEGSAGSDSPGPPASRAPEAAAGAASDAAGSAAGTSSSAGAASPPPASTRAR